MVVNNIEIFQERKKSKSGQYAYEQHKNFPKDKG